MATSVPFSGRMVEVRLSEVPVTVRRRFGRRMLEAAIADGNVLEAVEINAAIEEPSSRPYWLPASSVEKVLGR